MKWFPIAAPLPKVKWTRVQISMREIYVLLYNELIKGGFADAVEVHSTIYLGIALSQGAMRYELWRIGKGKEGASKNCRQTRKCWVHQKGISKYKRIFGWQTDVPERYSAPKSCSNKHPQGRRQSRRRLSVAGLDCNVYWCTCNQSAKPKHLLVTQSARSVPLRCWL